MATKTPTMSPRERRLWITIQAIRSLLRRKHGDSFSPLGARALLEQVEDVADKAVIDELERVAERVGFCQREADGTEALAGEQP